MEKRDAFRYVLIGAIGIVLVSILLVLRGGLTGYLIFEQTEEANFTGTYLNTTYNGSAVVLSEDNLTGTYTSQIFDAGENSTWNNLSWVSVKPNLESFSCVDGGGDVYKSINGGVNWSMTNEDYGRTSDSQEMISDSDYLYIVSNSNREIWRSGDNGGSFSVVNDSFADSGLLIAESEGENLFVGDASGDVYISTDNGVTWTLQGDFNGGATNNARGMGINSDDIYILDGSKAVYYSSNLGVDWTQQTADYGGGGASLDDVEVDSSGNVYIVDNRDVWKSTDQGQSWSKINDSFTSYSTDACKALIDSSGNFFIVDCMGRVFKSIDLGVSWGEIGDCNTDDASSDPKGLTDFSQATTLDIQVKSCDDDACSGESWVDISDTSPQDLSVDNNQYFQYKIDFTSPDSSVSPSLTSVDINYDLVNTAPSINLVLPDEGDSYGYNESIALNFSVSDSDDNLESCWYNLDGGSNFSI